MPDIEVLRTGGFEHLIEKSKEYSDRPGGVGTQQLADGAVTNAKVATGAITQQKLASNSVSMVKIQDGVVTNEKLDPYGVLLDVANLEEAIRHIDATVDPDDLSLEQDEETGLVYVCYRGVRSSNGIPLAGGGGGGGGQGGNNAVMSATNTSGWLAKTVSTGSECVVSLTWSSLENDVPTGDGVLMVTVNNVTRSTQSVQQGAITFDVGPYLTAGTNRVKARVSDVYDNSRTITYTITCVELSLRSGFDPSSPFAAGADIDFPYVPVGSLEKTMHFVVDGTQIATETVSVSGRQQTKAIPGMAHGAHSILAYFTASIDGQTVSSNELYYEIAVVSQTATTPIIITPFRQSAATQYDMLSIPYTVYTPGSLTSQVALKANGTTVSSVTVDRTEHEWQYRCLATGSLALTIESGIATRTINLTVAQSSIHVEPESASLALHLGSYGRSNGESDPSVWEDEDNDISATLTGFNFVSNGWVRDPDNMTVLRVNNGAAVTIPYKPFRNDFRATGKTVEVEFAVRDVLDYDAVALTCMSNGRGLQLTAQYATMKSEQTTIRTQYKEDEHVRVSFVAQKRTEDRLLLIYINGIASGVVQYPDDDDFSQQSPANITIGAAGITVDVYNIRVYDNDLTRYQILDNWIADTQDAELMLERYNHNAVYDEYGRITRDRLPTNLPYFVLSAPELPQYKGDKKTITGSYVDMQDQSRSFTFEGCQINVQGTSSAPYARKNYDMQFKQGFLMANGTHTDNYALASTVVPFNRFVLKADVASSEGANNVELVKLYCDADPYRRPEEQADAKVRKGIYGFPIVVFWHDTTTDTVSFLGKYNFNLPKRAPGPYGYSGDMESWELQNNTSSLMLFQSDYFDETPYTDPTTGDTKELWRYDYEARFPSDEWVDYAKLQELQTFVYSTYRANATGDALEEPVTYDDVTYTTDTAAYRLAKFRNEFGNYAEVQSFVFYYIFTELFLMVDSRAKNLFIGFSGSAATGLEHIDRKAVAEPYDMDTAIGTNNEGSLVFGYGLEDVDTVSGANVFNGQNSVLWCNVRDAFGPQIVNMYQTLRSMGKLSYQLVEQRFEAHQSYWPEAVYNEDAWFKYILPLTDPDPGKQPTDLYLPMMQGSKAEQRKWWLYNRFRYLDSKWMAGDATLYRIQLRGYAKADITVTPYSDIYATVMYGSYVVSARGTHGTQTTLACPLTTVNDTEIYVYSAPQLQSVGDLSGLKVGLADFSQANKLTSIKVGSDASGYSNPNLTSLSVGTNRLLATVDARNCPNLVGTIDLTGAANIENVYLGGTAVTSVSLPVGGVLKVLSLPSTITNLTVRDQPGITTFAIPSTANVSTLRVENCGTAIPVLTILDGMAPNSRVRIIGFTMVASSTTDVEDFYDYLDTMRGLDEYGNNLDNPVVSGSVTGLGTITGAWLAEMVARYPDVTIAYEHITSTLTYKSYDGSTTLQTETITDGGNGTYSGTPTRTSTAQYEFTFVGWSLDTDQQTANPSATTGVTADRTVYAAYSRTLRSYTVTWKNADNTTLETDQSVPYGTTPTYDGATPTYQGQTSSWWNPSVGPVTGDTTYTAIYIPVYQCRFYSGTSSSSAGTLLQTVSVQQGSDATYTGTTPTLPDQSWMTFTGWDKPLTNIQTATDFFAQYSDTRSPVIKYVERTMTDYSSSTATSIASYAFEESPIATAETSATSIGSYAFASCGSLETVELTSTSAVTIGASAFKSCGSLSALIIRSTVMSTLTNANALDSTPIAGGFGAVYVPSGLVATYRNDSVWSRYRIASVDDYPLTSYETIDDTWAGIIASAQGGTAASKYSVGDTKLLDLGTLGKQHFRVAKVDGTGITFVSAGTVGSTTGINPNNSSGTQGTGGNGGWEYCELRAYLSETVLPAFPTELRTAIKSVTKYSSNVVPGQSAKTVDGCETQDKLWLLSHHEVTGSNDYETQGDYYSGVFSGSLVMRKANGSATSWWLRSAYSPSSFVYIKDSGTVGTSNTATTYGVVFGFCL